VTTLTLQSLGAATAAANGAAAPSHSGRRHASHAPAAKPEDTLKRHLPMGERFNLLPPRVQQEVVSRVIDWGVMNAIDEARLRNPGRAISGLGDLSQAEQQSTADSISSLLSPILGSTLSSTATSLSQQAATVIGPVIEQKLAAYGPIFALIMGLTTATFTLLGMALFGGYMLKKLQ
jgi:hypothetical protein